VCAGPAARGMSTMWKGKFFLQTGLPGSLPRAPTVLYDPDYPPISRKDKRKRQEAKKIPNGCRGKDRGRRRARTPILFNFFESVKRVEARELDSGCSTLPDQLKVEFAALTKSERAYWDFMHDLFILYRDQQAEVRITEFRSFPKPRMRKILVGEFYNLPEPAQLQLVRDQLAVRWQHENLEFAKENCEQQDRNLITDIRKDVADILLKIDAVIRHTPASADEDIN
jgi:hypothetical protein